jgi:hypothetical protein
VSPVPKPDEIQTLTLVTVAALLVSETVTDGSRKTGVPE